MCSLFQNCLIVLVFPWLLRGQQYKFRVYATNNVSLSSPGPWTELFLNGVDGEHYNKLMCLRVIVDYRLDSQSENIRSLFVMGHNVSNPHRGNPLG